jgi:short-subunit dehydrogenase
MSKFTVAVMKAKELSNRTALVTGAGTGIGAAITERLAARGVHLVMVARDAARLESVAERLRAQHQVDVLTVPLDLSLPDAPARLAAQLGETGIELDILINNAGAAKVGPVAKADPADLRALIDVK